MTDWTLIRWLNGVCWSPCYHLYYLYHEWSAKQHLYSRWICRYPKWQWAALSCAPFYDSSYATGNGGILQEDWIWCTHGRWGGKIFFFSKCHSILGPMSGCWPMPAVADAVCWPMPSVGRCHSWADGVSWLLLAWLSIPLTDEFTVWKHAGYAILHSGPEHATATGRSSKCRVLVCMTVI